MRKSPTNEELEKGLEGMFPEPDAAFLNRLESRLVRQAQMSAAPARRPVPRRAFGIAFASLALALALVIVGIGPQKVLAGVQQLIGYVPGIGFVQNPEQPLRVLASQTQASRGGVTVTIEKGLVDSQGTQIRIRVEGVPQDKALFEEGWGEQNPPELKLPDGRRLPLKGSVSGAGENIWAEYTFDPLPEGVNDAGLLLPRIPGVKAGVAPENWEIPMHFHEATEGAGIVSATQAPQASEPVSGTRLIVSGVATSGEQTALNVRLESEDPAWRPEGAWWKDLELMDEYGVSMPLTEEQTLNQISNPEHVMLAPGLEPGKRYHLILSTATWEISAGVDGKAPGFRLDLPEQETTGQGWSVEWDVNENIQQAGYDLHVRKAALSEGAQGGLVLTLKLDPVEGLHGVSFRCKDMQVCSSSGFTWAESGEPLVTEVYLEQAPGRAVDLQLERLFNEIYGPWNVDIVGP